MGVSRQCAHRWVNRFRDEGPAGLEDRSSRPHRCPTRTPDEIEQRVLDTRRRLRRGPAQLSVECGVPARTISRILARHGVPRLAACDPLTGEVIRASKHTAVRYERERSGELVHMDVKKLGRIPDGGGWRSRGRAAVSTSRRRKNGAGYDFIHAVVDDHSRYAYAEIHSDERADTCAGFFERALDHFNQLGVTVERVMTDNAWSYRHGRQLRDLLDARGIKHKFIRPHCPWQNGKIERFNRTLASEWAYARAYDTNRQRNAALPDFLHRYNHERPHSAIGGHPPQHRLSST